MVNSLKGMMGKPSPTFANNPETMLMNMLAQKNPQAYQQFIQFKNSGQSPQQILNSLTANMPQQELQQIKTMASQFGIR